MTPRMRGLQSFYCRPVADQNTAIRINSNSASGLMVTVFESYSNDRGYLNETVFSSFFFLYYCFATRKLYRVSKLALLSGYPSMRSKCFITKRAKDLLPSTTPPPSFFHHTYSIYIYVCNRRRLSGRIVEGKTRKKPRRKRKTRGFIFMVLYNDIPIGHTVSPAVYRMR